MALILALKRWVKRSEAAENWKGMNNMKKKMITLAMAVVMVFGISVTAMANEPVYGFGGCQFGDRGMAGYGLMWAEDGRTFLSRDAFEDRVDDLIEQGLISSADKDALMERYDWCAANGGGALGRGFCGRGAGRGGSPRFNQSRWA